MRFNFVAKVDFNTQDAKVPGFREIKGKANGISMNLTAIAEQNNRAFLELAGFENDVIKTYDTEGNKIEVSWGDRSAPDVVKSVAGFRKNVIVLDGERHEFIAALDFINFIRDNLDDIKGKEFTITGQTSKNEYNGKISERFQIQNMFEVTDDRKHQLKVTGEFFFVYDSVDTSDWKDEKRIKFDGWTKEYMSKEHPSCYVPKQIVFDASRVDFDNERHLALLSFKLKQMGLSLDGDRIKNELKKSGIYSNNVTLNYINGATKIDFDESQLTAIQKEMVSLGLKTIDDFRPAGNIYGERRVEFKLVDFDLRGDYADGMIKLDVSRKEFDEDIYEPIQEETEEDFEAKMNPTVEDKKSNADSDDIDANDIFG